MFIVHLKEFYASVIYINIEITFRLECLACLVEQGCQGKSLTALLLLFFCFNAGHENEVRSAALEPAYSGQRPRSRWHS